MVMPAVSHTPTMDAMEKDKLLWIEEDEVRARRYEPVVKELGIKNNVDRRKFEFMAEQIQRHMISDISKDKKWLRRRWNEAVRDLNGRGAPYHEGSVLSLISGTLPEENLDLLSVHWQSTEMIRAIAGYYPLKKPQAAIWYRFPALRDAYTKDGVTYTANTAQYMNLKRTGGSLNLGLYEEDEGELIPMIRSRFASQQVDVDSYKLGWKESVEAIMDFSAEFPGDIRDYDSMDVVKLQGLYALNQVLLTLIAAVPGAHNANFDPDGYLDAVYDEERFTAEWKWVQAKLSKAISDVNKLVYEDIGEHINVIVGSTTTLQDFFDLRHHEGTKMRFSGETDILQRSGSLGKAGGYFVGTFDGLYDVYCLHDDVWPSTGANKFVCLWRGEFRSFENAVVYSPYQVGYRSPRQVDNDTLLESMTFMDRYAVTGITAMANSLGTVTRV